MGTKPPVPSRTTFTVPPGLTGVPGAGETMRMPPASTLGPRGAGGSSGLVWAWEGSNHSGSGPSSESNATLPPPPPVHRGGALGAGSEGSKEPPLMGLLSNWMIRVVTAALLGALKCSRSRAVALIWKVVVPASEAPPRWSISEANRSKSWLQNNLLGWTLLAGGLSMLARMMRFQYAGGRRSSVSGWYFSILSYNTLSLSKTSPRAWGLSRFMA